MVTQIIKIGNSCAICVPKIILDQTDLTEEVEIEVKNKKLIIRSGKHPRKNWGKAFRLIAENSDQLFDPESLTTQNRWDEKEWEW